MNWTRNLMTAALPGQLSNTQDNSTVNRNHFRGLTFISVLYALIFSLPAYASTPTFSIAFSPTTIAPGATSTLTYTINHTANATGVSDVNFTDTLPSGMTIKNPNNANLSGTCVDGSYTATAGSSSISFSGYRIGGGTTCTLSIDVTSSTNGPHSHTTGALSTSAGSAGTANATLTVDDSRPGFSMAFSPATITPGAVSTLTYTFDNSVNNSDATLFSFSHSLVSGLTFASNPNLTYNCAAGSFNVDPGGSSLTTVTNIAYMKFTANTSCTLSVDVTASSAGTYITQTNELKSAFNVSSGTTTAQLAVETPFLNMTFPTSASPGQSITLTYSMINNDRNNNATGISFTNDLNATLSGLAATALPATGFCGSGSTISGTSTISVSNASIESGSSCTFSITVLVPANAAAGTYTNNTSTINLTLGSATTKTAATNSLIIKKAPLLTALFIDDPVVGGSDVTLRYTITNTDTANAASSIAFTQQVNSSIGAMVIKSEGTSSTCSAGSFTQITDTNLGTLHAVISGVEVAAGASCTFDYILTVPTDAAPGSHAFTTSALSASISGSTIYGVAATDNLTVISAPNLQFSITESSAKAGGTVTAVMTLDYSADAAADVTGLGFTVDLNGALTGLASTTSTQSNICGTGSSLSGTSTLTFSGGTLSPGTNCSMTVTLQVPAGTAPGTTTITTSTMTGTTSSKTVTSATASDSFQVSGLTLSHTFVTNPVIPSSSTILRYTITNDAAAPAASSISFTHSLSSVLSSLTASSTPNTPCGASSGITGPTSLSFTGGELAAGASCTFDVPLAVPANASDGNYNSITGGMSAVVNSVNTSTEASSNTLVVESLAVILSTTAETTTSTSPIPISINFTRAVTNFIASDLTVTNGSASNLATSDNIAWTADITPSADGAVTVVLPVDTVDDSTDANHKNPVSNTLSVTYSATPATPTPTLVIGSASASQTNAGPVTYTVTYTNAEEVNLTSSLITLNKTNTATATVAVTNGTTATPTVTLSSISGDGTLGFSIAANTARNGTESSAAAGPSGTFTVDNTKPTVTISDTVDPSVNTSFTATFTFSEVVSNFVVGDITATNATLTNFTNVSNGNTTFTVLVTPTTEGSVTLDVAAGVADDSVGNTNSVATQHVVTYDTISPTLAISGSNTPVNSAFTATFTFSEDVTGFVSSDITASNASLSNFSATSAKIYTATVTPTTDGTVTLDVAASKAIDAASNNNTAANQYSVTYDSTKPTVSISGASSPTNAAFTATFTFSEDVTGFQESDISVSNAQVKSFSATSSKVYTLSITPTSDGQVTIDIPADVAIDSANNGNTAATQYSTNYDATKPTIAISGPTAPTNAAYTATITFSEDVTGFTESDITVISATLSNFAATSATVYTVQVTPSAEGNTKISIAASSATDSAGNGNTASSELIVVYDVTKPTVTITGPTAPTNAAFTATFTFTEDVTGFTDSDITASNATLTSFSATSATVYTALVTPSAQGTVTLDISTGLAFDTANNGNDAATQYSVTYDSVAPTVDISGPTTSQNAAFTATFTFSEEVTGFAVTDISVSNASLSAFNATSTKVYTATVTPSSEGLVTLDVAANTAIDSASNNNTAATQFSLTYDSVSPTLAISGPTGAVNSAFTATFTFAEDVTGFTSSDITISNGTASNFSSTSSKIYTATITPTSNGNVTIDVAASTAQDGAGNNNTAATQFTIEYDNLKPGVTITSPSADVNAAFTATFTFSKAVSDFSVSKIVSTNAVLSDFNSTSAPVYTVTVTPSAAGTVTLAVAVDTVSDAAGNTNAASNTLSVTFDQTNPTLSTLSPTNGAVDVAVSPSLVMTFDESIAASSSTSNNTISIKLLSDNSVIETIATSSSAVSISGSVATITLSQTLAEYTEYYVEVGSSAFIDIAGNSYAGLSGNSVWKFRVINLPPITTKDTLVINEDNAGKIQVLANDNGDNSKLNPASVEVKTAPSNGQVSVNTANGIVTYKPNADFNGSDSFTYIVSDIIGTYSAETTVGVTVNATNDAPVANNDVASVAQNANITINVTSNDVDADGQINTSGLMIIKRPVSGVAQIINGQIKYTPNSGYSGSDIIEYAVVDNGGLSSNTATVYINVAGTNTSPTAATDSTSTNENTLVNINVLSNDTDSDGSIDATSVTVVNNTANGTLSVQSDGSVNYTPTTGFSGSDSFTYIVKDNLGAYSTTGNVSITVSAVNTAPEALADTVVLVDKTNSHFINVLGNDLDSDGTIASISIISQATSGTASVDSAKLLISYTPSASFGTSDSFSYQITDNNGATSATATVNVADTAANDPPLANDDKVQTAEDQFVDISVLSNDIDIDGVFNHQTLSVSSSPSNGSASVKQSTGTIFYTPNANFTGSDRFTYQVSDNSGSSTSATVDILVTSLNDAPSAAASSVRTNEDTPLSITLSGTDPENDALSYHLGRNPSSGALSGTLPNLTYTPNSQYNGFDSFTFYVNDGSIDSSVATVSITINAVNDAPVANAQTLQTNEDTALSLILTGSDIDNNPLTYVIKSSPSNGTLSGTGANRVYTPAANFFGTDSFTFVVNDGTVDSAIASVSITVAALNDAPVAVAQTQTTEEDNPVSLTISGTDIDSQSLTYTVASQPINGTVTGTAPALQYTPNANFNGTDSFTFTASDGLLTSNTATVTLTVTAVNDTPVANALNVIGQEDLALSITLTGADIDGDTLSYAINSQPTNGLLSGVSPNMVYQPNANFNGSDSFTFVANDGQINSAPVTVGITVNAVNDLPIAVDDSVTTNGWTAFNIDVLSNDSDADGNALSIIGATSASGALSFTSSALSYTPVNGFVGSVIINYTISDGNGGTASAKVTAQVNAPAGQSGALVQVPADIDIDADSLITKVNTGVATAFDSQGKPLPVSMLNENTFFKPGTNTVLWQAEDEQGNTTIVSQQINVRPQITIDSDKAAQEGYSTTVAVHLNGQAPSYPVHIPYSVGGSADIDLDHNLTDGVLTIESGTQGHITFNLYQDDIFEGDETIVIELDDSLNLGYQTQHTLTLTERNLPPELEFTVVQNGHKNVSVFKDQGMTEIIAAASHPDSTKQYQYTWSSDNEALHEQLQNIDRNSFDPSELESGLYRVSLVVEDPQDSEVLVHKQLSIMVLDSAIRLSTNDSDNDGINDLSEGFNDSDNDGIADYLDAISQCNVLQSNIQSSNRYLLESQSSSCLALGDIALSHATGANNHSQNTLGGLFDLVANKLPLPGQNTALVLPLRKALPSNALFQRKMLDGQWTAFVENADNHLMSAPGEAGYCPSPGDNRWQNGLTKGHWCIQVTISDGGANDNDSLINGVVALRGAVAQSQGNTLPDAVDDVELARINTATTFDVLHNDFDSDNDNLTITSAHAVLGQVTIIDNKLHYSPAQDWVGEDVLHYAVDDNQGGSASARLTVTIVNNAAPVGGIDSATVESGQSVIIDVLANDNDADSDTLQVVWAQALNGQVIIGADNKLTYTPNNGFSGEDTLTYRLSDGVRVDGQSQVNITVTARQTDPVQPTNPAPEQSSSGGGGSAAWLWLMCLFIASRRVKIRR